MKIELKKLKILTSQSKETNCFTAELFVDNMLVAHTHNDGWGGNTIINIIDNAKAKELFINAEAYCKSLPKTKYNNDMELRIVH